LGGSPAAAGLAGGHAADASDAESDFDSDGEPYSEPDVDSDSEPYTGSDVDSDSEPYTEPYTERRW
jgi:hypothetical protein